MVFASCIILVYMIYMYKHIWFSSNAALSLYMSVWLCVPPLPFGSTFFIIPKPLFESVYKLQRETETSSRSQCDDNRKPSSVLAAFELNRTELYCGQCEDDDDDKEMIWKAANLYHERWKNTYRQNMFACLWCEMGFCSVWVDKHCCRWVII